MQDVRHDGSIPGAYPWFDRYIVPGSRCLLAPGNGFFLRLAVPPMGGGTVCTYRGCGYRVPAWKRPGAQTVRSGPADAENGPGSRCAASAAGERQALKLMGYTSHVGGMRPRKGRPLTPGPAHRAHDGQRGQVYLANVPAPGRQRTGRARYKGPPMLMSPHQATSDTARSSRKKEKEKSLF